MKIEKVSLPDIRGIKMAVSSTGISSKPYDLLLVVFDTPCSVGGVFTQSTTCSENILSCRKNLSVYHPTARVLVVNSGNANAFNGSCGRAAVEEIVEVCAAKFNCKAEEVFFSSTGIIGVPLPLTHIKEALQNASFKLAPDSWDAAARAIMTTDTYPKAVSRKVLLGGKEVIINGICKGAGMIAPNMGTMLCYVFTDANLPSHIIQKMLQKIVPITFNSITIDGDTSTSDTLIVFATNEVKLNADTDLDAFEKSLHDVLLTLAHMIVRDSEGTANKLVEITVGNCISQEQAHMVAMEIAKSLLVRCALFCKDAFNWGRVAMAIGKTGIVLKNPISISVGGISLLDKNEAVLDFDHNALTSHLSSDTIKIYVDISLGEASATVWTCELTPDYIAINSDYIT